MPISKLNFSTTQAACSERIITLQGKIAKEQVNNDYRADSYKGSLDEILSRYALVLLDPKPSRETKDLADSYNIVARSIGVQEIPVPKLPPPSQVDALVQAVKEDPKIAAEVLAKLDKASEKKEAAGGAPAAPANWTYLGWFSDAIMGVLSTIYGAISNFSKTEIQEARDQIAEIVAEQKN